VEIADDAFRAAYAFAVELEFDAQNSVSGRMLRPHVEDKFVGTEEGAVFLRCVFDHFVCHVS
jgi:hypothetical protein